AAQAMTGGVYHAATDITGFGLLGHAWEMAGKTGVRFRFHFDSLPFVYGARALADDWLFPGGSNRNEEAYQAHVDFGPNMTDEMRLLLFTPETSGGLLVALPPAEVEPFRARCDVLNQPSWVVGGVLEGEGIEVY
ncbi:MAG: selenide, water dikinase SelD, partial [Anaerolineales bacterium]|nr:selenide, water dikinase SelD [Anaerolineales bacterium]